MNNETSAPTAAKLKQWIPIGLIVLLATGLRLYQLSTESLWVDEMISVGDAENFQFKLPYSRPLYFLLLNFWMHFGSSDAWLRGLAVIFGIGSVFLTYQLGRRVMGEPTGLIAALVMALSPLFINHSQEIRMYSLNSFLSLLGTLALTHVLEDPTYAALGCWSIARILLLITNANNVLIMLPDLLLFGWKYRQQRRWLLAFGVALVPITIFFLPVLWVNTIGGAVEEFMDRQVSGYSKPGMLQIVGMITQVAVYWPIRYLLKSNQIVLPNDQLSDASLLSNFLTAKTVSLLYYGGFTIVLFALLGIVFIGLFKHRSEKLLWMTAWAFLPAACMLSISLLKNSIWFPRYLLFIAPYFLILLAAGFMVVWHWRRQAAIAVIIAYFIAVGGGLKDYYTTFYRNDWQGAAKLITVNEQPGDAIVFHAVNSDSWKPEYSFKRYYQGNSPVYLISNPGQDREFDRAFILNELGTIPTVESRLWLVCWRVCKPEKENLIFEMIMGEKFQIERHEIFDETMEWQLINIFLVTNKSSGKPSNSP